MKYNRTLGIRRLKTNKGYIGITEFFMDIPMKEIVDLPLSWDPKMKRGSEEHRQMVLTICANFTMNWMKVLPRVSRFSKEDIGMRMTTKEVRGWLKMAADSTFTRGDLNDALLGEMSDVERLISVALAILEIKGQVKKVKS